jgi:hypothetical protein
LVNLGWPANTLTSLARLGQTLFGSLADLAALFCRNGIAYVCDKPLMRFATVCAVTIHQPPNVALCLL